MDGPLGRTPARGTPAVLSVGHHDRGVEIPAFRPRRKRRFTSPEMSAVFASVLRMSRYRLVPSPAQEAVLRDHLRPRPVCSVWNLAVEQHRHWHPGRASAPGYLEQCRQLTTARAEHPWLAAGSQMVQQQALRDFAQGYGELLRRVRMAAPSWRKAGRDEGSGSLAAPSPGEVRRLSRHVGQVRVPKAGWVRFRWSRAVPVERVLRRATMDRAGRWHVAFTVVPEPIPAPGTATARRWASTAAWRCPLPCPPVSSCALPGWLIRVHAVRASSRRARWLVRVRSSGWPFHQACSRIRLSAAAALVCSRRVLASPR